MSREPKKYWLGGYQYTLAEIAKRKKIKLSCLISRLMRGVPLTKAILKVVPNDTGTNRGNDEWKLLSSKPRTESLKDLSKTKVENTSIIYKKVTSTCPRCFKKHKVRMYVEKDQTKIPPKLCSSCKCIANAHSSSILPSVNITGIRK